jgi:hypothetical protein
MPAGERRQFSFSDLIIRWFPVGKTCGSEIDNEIDSDIFRAMSRSAFLRAQEMNNR